mgnify:FL=1
MSQEHHSLIALRFAAICPETIATTSSPRHIQTVLEDAKAAIAHLAAEVERLNNTILLGAAYIDDSAPRTASARLRAAYIPQLEDDQ